MTTGYAPLPSVKTGTPPREWSESILASNPPRDTPATYSDVLGRTDNSKMTEGKSREEFQVQKELESSYLSFEERKQQPHLSLPSTELRGAQPSERTGGVGALPGNLSESSVALLPDERQERAQEYLPTSPRQRRDTIKPSTVGGDVELGEFGKGGEVEVLQGAALSKDEPIVSQPLDALPKSTEMRAAEIAESDIAARSGPEIESQKEVRETRSQGVLSEQAKVAGVAATTGVVVSAEEPGEKKENAEGALEKFGQEKGLLQDVQEEGDKRRTTAGGKIEEDYSGGYHPAQLHPPPPGTSVAEYQTSVGSQQGQELPSTRTGKRASVGTEKKPGFMRMVKGEMKILAGKMSGDVQKVEEGKKTVHGET